MATTIRTWPGQKNTHVRTWGIGSCLHPCILLWLSLLETFAGSQSSRLVHEASYNQHSYLQHLISTLVPGMTTSAQIFWRVNSSNTSLENDSWSYILVSNSILHSLSVTCQLSQDFWVKTWYHVLNSNLPNNRQIHLILTYESDDNLCSNDDQLKPSTIF